jgi:hypothetical protein
MVLATPHEHLFRPQNECLPGKGHRMGGVGGLITKRKK